MEQEEMGKYIIYGLKHMLIEKDRKKDLLKTFKRDKKRKKNSDNKICFIIFKNDYVFS